ncbi:40s ribosomal protein s5-1 [Hordeum vulgare]|nr:40s ribosomal protein s5-1 [Hordeum vulgare]
METRLEAMEQQVFKCQGMVEHGLNANHMMITNFTSNHKMDAINIGKHLSRLYDRVGQLQGQIYGLQNQNSVATSLYVIKVVYSTWNFVPNPLENLECQGNSHSSLSNVV